MAKRLKKVEVIAALKAIVGLEFDENGKYNDLCRLLKAQTATKTPEPTPEAAPLEGPIRLSNRRKKRSTFLADSVRDQSDRDFINNELGTTRGSGLKRKYKGKIKTVTTIKHYDLIDGDVVTEFIIDLKE